MAARVVITGLGLCTSLGQEREAAARRLALGRPAFAMSPHLPFVVCPVDLEDDAEDEAGARLKKWRHRRYLSRAGFFAVLAGLRAALDAGEGAIGLETGIIGTAAPTLDFEREQGLPPADALNLDALWLLRWLPNTCLSALSILLGIHGAGLTLGCACASGLMSLGEAWLKVRHGIMPSCLAAAGDSRLSLGGLLGYSKAHTLSTCQNPELASRPFDAERCGFVPGEGGAAFFLEEREHALARGAKIFGEVLGYGASLDGTSLTAPDADGTFAEQAVRRALAEAGMSPADIDWVSAHGTGTRANDAAEAAVLQRVFSKEPQPKVTALKSWIGHCSAAAGAVEAALCLCTAARGFIPAIRGLENPIAELNFVRERPAKVPEHSVGLLESFGFGGQNAALVLRVGEAL